MSERIVLKFLSLQTHRNKISNRNDRGTEILKSGPDHAMAALTTMFSHLSRMEVVSLLASIRHSLTGRSLLS